MPKPQKLLPIPLIRLWEDASVSGWIQVNPLEFLVHPDSVPVLVEHLRKLGHPILTGDLPIQSALTLDGNKPGDS